MNIDEIREYCLSKKGVSEGFPFNDTALVLKVEDKMFALLDLSEENEPFIICIIRQLQHSWIHNGKGEM